MTVLVLKMLCYSFKIIESEDLKFPVVHFPVTQNMSCSISCKILPHFALILGNTQPS